MGGAPADAIEVKPLSLAFRHVFDTCDRKTARGPEKIDEAPCLCGKRPREKGVVHLDDSLLDLE